MTQVAEGTEANRAGMRQVADPLPATELARNAIERLKLTATKWEG